MNLFVDYIQPLISWLQANPSWALFFTFIISLTESLAVVGSIIPGSITMTAIGIMAGSGIMRIDLTLGAAILGAVFGDGMSYFLGYFYSDQLADKWPFRKYPALLAYGKDFFERHGGKSVFLGRFVGPLRSIIPVIAGILHMPRWRFLLANFFSAIGWSILYVMPGVLIGAASHELSAERATSLILLIFAILVGIWLLGIVINWALVKINRYLKTNLHIFWLKLKKHPLLYRIVNQLTPKNEINHYQTVSLLLLTLLYFICFITLLFLTLETNKILLIDGPIHSLIYSIHTRLLELIFIFCSQLTSYFTLSIIFITASAWFCYYRDLRAIIYTISAILWGLLVAKLFSFLIYIPRPQNLLVVMPGSSFLNTQLVIASAMYVFLHFYIKSKYCLLTNTLRTFILMMLGMSGLAYIYLGDSWLTDILASLSCGTTIGLIHCLVYRKKEPKVTRTTHSTPMLLSFFLVLISVTGLATLLNFKTSIHNHTPYHKEFTLSDNEWWDQNKPLLPLFRLNRFGKPLSLLNIQYSGDLAVLENSLVEHGWKSHKETVFNNILNRLNANKDTVKLPIFTQLYDNKPPEMLMTYQDTSKKLVLELRIWESNFFLPGLNHPIWLGSVHRNKPVRSNTSLDVLSYLLPALDLNTVRRIDIPQNKMPPMTFPAAPYILLIK